MHADDRFGPNDGKYVNVYNLANNLLKYDEQIIKKAREYEPNISKIPIPLLLNICPQINHNLLNALSHFTGETFGSKYSIEF